ncbi:MAG: NUDIX hydrolase [Lachnospiraceae bacterium]|nr:NUDIX hydrolase [Lachnospiraceae bacterium]
MVSNMAELWDAYNDKFEKLEGVTLVRGEKIEGDCYHMVCDVVVKHSDGSYLLMQRDYNKSHAGCWELTAGGSVLKDEKVEDGAVRELREETGITGLELKEIGRDVSDYHRALYIVYFGVYSGDKNSIILQRGETIAYKWVSRETLLKMPPYEMCSSRALGFLKEADL